MQLICSFCGRDLNEIYQDNMSYEPGTVCCEDCYTRTVDNTDEIGRWSE